MMVDVVVDEQGRMMDYAIVAGASVLAKRRLAGVWRTIWCFRISLRPPAPASP